ncbi:MAG: hypothetical protein ACOC9S_00255 [Planctomycetota bacterium]
MRKIVMVLAEIGFSTSGAARSSSGQHYNGTAKPYPRNMMPTVGELSSAGGAGTVYEGK